jgi:hypothetical protein
MSDLLTSAAERESARLICNRLQQATRSLRLYPADHPTSHQVLEDFSRELNAHIDKYGPLILRVEENQLLYEDQEIYYQEDMRSSLAFTMFRDGIRFLTFHAGIDAAEAESFADCLAHADDLGSMEHDLATVLWERDLQHVEYEVADPFLGVSGETRRSEAISDLRATVLRRLGELSPGSGGSGPAGEASAGGGSGGGGAGGGGGDGEPGEGPGAPETVAPETVLVTEADIQYGEVAVASLGNVLGDFAVVLLEIAGLGAGSPEDDPLPRALGMVVERYLDTLEIEELARIVDRLVALEQQGRRPRGFGAEVFGGAATSERLTRLIESTDTAGPDQAQKTEDMLRKMRNWVMPGLLEILAESNDKGVRKNALDLLDMEGGVPVEYLWPLMEDPRWYVVRNAVALATGSGDPHLIDHLESLLRHADARVRREVIRSLDTLAGPRPALAFVRAMNDEDTGVRVLAANGLGRHGSRANVPLLEAQIESRDFAARPAEEINAILLAYATLGGEASVEMLDRMWRRRMFGTRPMGVRLGAILALGAVHSPLAHDALMEASKSNEAQIQRTATRTLAEARARMMGDRA